MKKDRAKRPVPSLQEEPELKNEVGEFTKEELGQTTEQKTIADPLDIPLRKLEQLFSEVQFEKAPAGLTERIMQRIRHALRQDLADLSADVHEALIQAYTIVWLSTLPLLIGAYWAVSKAEQVDAMSIDKIADQVSDILQSMTVSYRELQPHQDDPTYSLAAGELEELSLKLIPLTVLNILGETIQELQNDLQRMDVVHRIQWAEAE